MSKLPSGYTELEYIQSTGTQYINTGFKPNNNTHVFLIANLTSTPTGNTSLFGARTAATSKNYAMLFIPPVFRSDYNNSYTQTWGITATTKRTYDKNKETTTLDGTSKSYTNALFQADYALYLFAINSAGASQWYASMQMYACQIYDNGTLVRNFIPCKNTSGVVGLYDTVEGQFYSNAGTGSFTAGPEVIHEPDAPADFTASVSSQTVVLSWAASANAAGYRLKRDGVQIADQTGTTYTDTVPDGTAFCTYTLTAYNDDGESAAATLTVILRLDLITDRTRADVANQTDKGFYNASDLNRVGAAVEYIADRFTALGYACPVSVKKDWLTTDAPTASQMEAYRQNIVTLRSQIAVMASTPEAPASMAGLDYVKANNIEQILADIDFILQNMPAASRHCGVTVCGSKGVIA